MLFNILFFLILMVIFCIQTYQEDNYDFFLSKDNNYAKKIAKEIENNLSSNFNLDSNKNNNSVCINKNTSQENIYEFMKYLRNDLLTTKYENSRLKEKLQKQNNDCQDYKNKENIKKSREELVDDMSGDASILSGLSNTETAKMLTSHLSKPLTMTSFLNEIDNQKPESTKDIMKRNENNSKYMDSYLNKKRPDKVDKLKDNYLMNNMINVDCSQDETPDGENILGDVLLQLSNNLGFKNKNCKKNDTQCQNEFLENARKKSIKALNNLTGIFGCQIKNEDKGLFPYNLQSFNNS